MEKTEQLAVETVGGEERYESILGDLPPFPPLAMRLAEVAGRDDTKVEEVVELLRSDAALSADLLRRANSPAYGFAANIDTLQQALVVLGFDELRRIALVAATKGFAGPVLQAPELRACWRHSLAVALLAEELARGSGVSPERAYTAGVMHDIGRLALLTARPDDLAAIISEATFGPSIDDTGYLLDREREKFGFDHTEAGSWLARRWDIPVDLQAAAGRHHDRPEAGPVSLLQVIQYAVLLADLIGFGVSPREELGSPAKLASDAPQELRPVLQRNPAELAEVLKRRIDALDGELPQAHPEPAPDAAPEEEPEGSEESESAEEAAEERARRLLPWVLGAVAALAAGLAYLVLWG